MLLLLLLSMLLTLITPSSLSSPFLRFSVQIQDTSPPSFSSFTIFVDNFTPFSLNNQAISPYIPLPSTPSLSHTISFVSNNNQMVESINVTLNDGDIVSYVLAGTAATNNYTIVEMSEDFDIPAGFAKVRFIHLIPGIGWISIKGNNTGIRIPYQTATNYFNFPISNSQYSFQFYIILLLRPFYSLPLLFSEESVYTVWITSCVYDDLQVVVTQDWPSAVFL